VAPSRLLLAFFLIAQACDGLFTYVVVDAFGPIAEGNLLLATWIGLVGAEPAIFGAKAIASAGGVLLHYQGLHRILLGLTLFYGVFAIGPWLLTLQQL
jgi:hypothetical protein